MHHYISKFRVRPIRILGRHPLLGFLAASLLGCAHVGPLSADSPEPYFHEDLTGEKREPVLMALLREERLKVDSAANGGGACQYGTLLGAAQDYAGVNLTDSQLDYLKTEFGKTQPSGRPTVDFNNNFLVIGSEAVVQRTLKLLTARDFHVVVRTQGQTSASERATAQYTMRITSGHRNLGDKEGVFLWEPLEYSRESSIKKGKPDSLRYIFIQPIPEGRGL